MKSPRFPVKIRRGSVETKVYRLKRRDGREVYTAAWTIGERRETRQFSDYAAAHAEASFKADLLAAGKVNAATTLTGDDAEMIAEARRVCGDTPILTALREWSKARQLTDGHLIAACEAWQARNTTRYKKITVADAVDQFIASKERAGRQGERTYRSKLDPLKEAFPGQTLDAISSRALEAYLEQWDDGVTRNDFRKRAVALWRWAYKKKHLPHGVPLEIEATERAEEKDTEIGTITPETYQRALELVRAKYPQHLPALVLAGFGAIRSDEIHGKRHDRSKRQLWEDTDLDLKHLNVTVAKKNTPAWRLVELCDAAIEWLKLTPEEKRKGPVCEAGAMEKLRTVLRDEGFELPENAFRHSAISYKIAVTNNKAAAADWAGNSEKEINKRYRRPMTRASGEAWFSITPSL